MLRIREEQVTVFEHAALRNFEDRMIAHLREFAPTHSKILTEDEMRLVIRHGMKQAESHRFTSERSIRIYTEFMLMLGSSFDTDPQLPWAAALLNDEMMTEEVLRIDQLKEKSWEYFDEVLPDFGNVDGDARRKQFIEQIRELGKKGDEILSSFNAEFYQRTVALLNLPLSKKSEQLGERVLRKVINHGIKSAKSYGISSERGITLFIVAMFLLGSGFDHDPQFPWATRVLNDQSITDQKERVDRLFAAAIECFNGLLRLLG